MNTMPTTTAPSAKEVLKEWKVSITDLAIEAGLSRFYVSEYINDPAGFRGTTKAVNAIQNAMTMLISKRKAERQNNLTKLNSILNTSQERIAS